MHSEIVVVLVSRNGMGEAPAPLAQLLLKKWLGLVLAQDRTPEAICFYGEGVKLVTEGSPVVAELAGLEKRGVHLVACQTCLEYFGLVDRVVVGSVGGMADIVDWQWRAGKLIQL